MQLLRMAGFALALACAGAHAQLKGTEMFDDRSAAPRKDVESRIDAIKRERIEQQKKSYQAQREREIKEQDNRCKCFYPNISSGTDCPFFSSLFLWRRNPKDSYEEDRAAYRAAVKKKERERQEFDRWRQEMHRTCRDWATSGRQMSDQEYGRRMGEMRARLDAAGREEADLVRQRELRKAEQSRRLQQAERDRIKGELQRQSDAENDRRRRDQLKTQQEMQTFRDRQRDSCKAEVARLGYPDSCVCQPVLNWHRAGSCGK